MIELKDVSFTYESGETENNLSHINLTIRDGETILLCGESGCGKTTLTWLINGLIPHYYGGKLTGQVLLDGKELKTILFIKSDSGWDLYSKTQGRNSTM